MIEPTAAIETATRLATVAAELMEDGLGEGALRPIVNAAACLERAAVLEALARDIMWLASAMAVLGRHARDQR